eukprot:TRINITY_DN4915_c0_g1_i3.p2 TRINITY_DN4915_c0_g1~~TRINITY_DN4915_c0_g1_i3.p2  ORF type:complete len:164 (-),score=24.31 TRINITY_DN4915_c0_g1_i3:321-812(-)
MRLSTECVMVVAGGQQAAARSVAVGAAGDADANATMAARGMAIAATTTGEYASDMDGARSAPSLVVGTAAAAVGWFAVDGPSVAFPAITSHGAKRLLIIKPPWGLGTTTLVPTRWTTTMKRASLLQATGTCQTRPTHRTPLQLLLTRSHPSSTLELGGVKEAD